MVVEWKEKALQKAEHAQFLLDTNSPEKFVNYFITNYIESLDNVITEINPEFYAINEQDYLTYIKIVNEEIRIQINDDVVKILKLTKNGWHIIFEIEFKDTLPMIGKGGRDVGIKELEKRDFDNIMSELLK